MAPANLFVSQRTGSHSAGISLTHSRIVLSVGGSVWYLVRNLRCTFTIDSVLSVVITTANTWQFDVSSQAALNSWQPKTAEEVIRHWIIWSMDRIIWFKIAYNSYFTMKMEMDSMELLKAIKEMTDAIRAKIKATWPETHATTSNTPIIILFSAYSFLRQFNLNHNFYLLDELDLLPFRINYEIMNLTVGRTPWTGDQPIRKAVAYTEQHKHPCL
jgi:hypothetical protein